MTRGLILIGVCFLLVLCVLIVGCFGGGVTEKERAIREQEQEQQKLERQTIAWKMAVVGEDGDFVPHGGDLEKEYEWYLNKLAEKTKQGKEDVGNITVKAWNMLREEVNPNEYLLDVLQDLYNAIPRGSEDIDLAEIAGLYVILRMNE